jgi:hypothetical protein
MRRDEIRVPEEVDERLREWAAYFKDRKRWDRCKSLEGLYQPHSEDYAKEGWGSNESAPTQPRLPVNVLRAIQTQELIQQLDRKYRWAITYGYCYPSLPKHMVTRLMKKYTGVRMSWALFLETLDIGRMRVYALIVRPQDVVLDACK